MFDYYTDKLAADRLVRVYELAPPRIARYLEAEIDYVLTRTGEGDEVLELGCGYGRVLSRLAGRVSWLCGIDTSPASLNFARHRYPRLSTAGLAVMDASRLGFADGAFDLVVCVQNGISAFHVDQKGLIAEALRVLRPKGRALFSSYSHKIWEDRLEWFRRQSREGLLGEIDPERTRRGTIVCRDGFTATTVTADDFRKLCRQLGVNPDIRDVDDSSVFCEIVKI